MLSPEPLQHRGIPGTKRCYLCNGPFGLIRHRLALKQFCSKQCLDQYKGKIESHGSRSKQWIDFLTRSPGALGFRIQAYPYRPVYSSPAVRQSGPTLLPLGPRKAGLEWRPRDAGAYLRL